MRVTHLGGNRTKTRINSILLQRGGGGGGGGGGGAECLQPMVELEVCGTAIFTVRQ